MADYPQASFHYNASGSNTLIQIEAIPVTIYSVSVSQNGGSVGYLQLYNNGTAPLTAGTLMNTTIPVYSGTAASGTPPNSIVPVRDIFYPQGKHFEKGFSYLWAAGTTGTVSHGVNAIIDITYTRY